MAAELQAYYGRSARECSDEEVLYLTYLRSAFHQSIRPKTEKQKTIKSARKGRR